jgi:restriction endonuclease Mrr
MNDHRTLQVTNMSIPEFNEIKAPALQFFFNDSTPHKASELYEVLAPHFKLTGDDLNEVLPSGKQRR